ARRAMAVVGAEIPEAREVALTLHGAGFGLDEIACFDAELAGLLDAFELGTVSGSLERVLIVEADVGRADRLRRHLAETVDGGTAAVAVPPDRNIVERVGGASSGATAEHDHAFVAMPFAQQFEDVFHYGIAPSVRGAGLLCERIDQAKFT